MEKIIEYLKKQYEPTTLVVYGSYADGTNNLNSDFDAFVITGKDTVSHDSSVINGIELDVFIYHTSYFENEIVEEEFVQLFDGEIIIDVNGTGLQLQKQVLEYVNNRKQKTDVENLRQLIWCEKMIKRLKRNDAESFYRWHWLLVDSLVIYFDICHYYYFGPKKALKYLENHDQEAFAFYRLALIQLEENKVSDWVLHMRNKYELLKFEK